MDQKVLLKLVKLRPNQILRKYERFHFFTQVFFPKVLLGCYTNDIEMIVSIVTANSGLVR